MANGNGSPKDAEEFDTGSKDRATVALVAAKVDEVKAIVAGEARVTSVKLDALHEKLAPLADLPARVGRLEERADDQERRTDNLESTRKGDHDWRREKLPLMFISGLVALASIIGVLTQVHF